MKRVKETIIILAIDTLLLKNPEFQTPIDEDTYIAFLYEHEKEFVQKIVLERDVPLHIFSSITNEPSESLSQTNEQKRLKDFLKDFRTKKVILISDQDTLLKQAKAFDKDIKTVQLNKLSEFSF